METHLTQWGNSLGLRIPKALAKSLGLTAGAKLRATTQGGKLVLTPIAGEANLDAHAKGVNLEAMVKKITPKNRPKPESFNDAPRGKEVW